MQLRNSIKLMLLSTLAFACMNGAVKYLDNIGAFQIVFFRSIGSLFFTFGYLLKNKIPLVGKNNKLLILRGVVGLTSMALFFMSTKYLSIGTAVSLRYLAPIFAAIFAVLILKEKIFPLQWVFFVFAFLGVVILKGFDSSLDTYGLTLILISALFRGLVYIIISKIGKSEHPVVVVNYFMVISAIVGGVLCIKDWIMPVGIQWLFLALLGVFGYFGQLLMTKAFQNAQTNQVAPIKYVEVIFTMILGIIIFGESYPFSSLFGILLIIVSLITNIIYKERKTKKLALENAKA
ncbi:DMT family transporter [Formosa sp. PL04]|uniref:DMT family transporter n=1 Tax=Formosa sp. PL04 TaxID=3081755 RepID=UPI0029818D39|nr:DMT family transporter [Formosa sp. PL04]MDW5288490.1 DMT family transporter [Formosa sp. PL04]